MRYNVPCRTSIYIKSLRWVNFSAVDIIYILILAINENTSGLPSPFIEFSEIYMLPRCEYIVIPIHCFYPSSFLHNSWYAVGSKENDIFYIERYWCHQRTHSLTSSAFWGPDPLSSSSSLSEMDSIPWAPKYTQHWTNLVHTPLSSIPVAPKEDWSCQF